jgi:AcrR family transcriptional regulator
MASTTGRLADPHARISTGFERELKQERAVLTRERILNAAAEAFARHGYSDVTLLEIAELMGMTKGAIYFHFKNKEALAVAVAENFYNHMSASSGSVVALGLEPLESAVEFLHQTAVSFRDDVLMKAGARLQIEHSSVGAPLPPPYVTFAGVIESWLEQAAELGQLPQGLSAAALSRVLVEVVFGAQHISWVQSDRTDIVERMDEIVRVVLRTEPRGA